MGAKYDLIGGTYAELRRPDPRVAKVIGAAPGSARTVLNAGAGTGSCEPAGRTLTAVEPSRAMIEERGRAAAPAVQASAGDLPFEDQSFDASMAVLTIHHRPDKAAGLHETRRATRGRIVLLTFDPAHRPRPTDRLPELAALDERRTPAMADRERWLGPAQVTPVPVPHDRTDGFLYAYWRRPRAYLDPYIRSGSSAFWAVGGAEAGSQNLRRDLETGAWERCYGDLLALDEYDAGYRLVVAD